MNWIQTHWLSVLCFWGAANAVLSPLSAKVPETTWYGKALHVFVALSPVDLLKAYRASKASLAVLPLAALLLHCQPSPIAGYRDEQVACVNDNSTKAAIDACRSQVKHKYCSDGGALGGLCSEGGAK